jgi:hypothetical protein
VVLEKIAVIIRFQEGVGAEGIPLRKLSSLEQVQLAASTEHYSHPSRYREKREKKRCKKRSAAMGPAGSMSIKRISQ